MHEYLQATEILKLCSGYETVYEKLVLHNYIRSFTDYYCLYDLCKVIYATIYIINVMCK